MEKVGIEAPFSSRRASLMVLDTKLESALKFCVHNHGQNALKKRGPHRILLTELVLALAQIVQFSQSWTKILVICESMSRRKTQKKTIFKSHYEFSQYKRTSFGVTYAPATLQRFLDVMLSRYEWKHDWYAWTTYLYFLRTQSSILSKKKNFCQPSKNQKSRSS